MTDVSAAGMPVIRWQMTSGAQSGFGLPLALQGNYTLVVFEQHSTTTSLLRSMEAVLWSVWRTLTSRDWCQEPGRAWRTSSTGSAPALTRVLSRTEGGNHGPYVQSQRLDIYKKHVNMLLDSGHAYRCFCTERRLELLKREAARVRAANKYDRRCLHLSQQEIADKVGQGMSHTVRFRLTAIPEPFDDMIYGPVAHDVNEFEGDPIIMKSDGYPTYHLANVVDDHLMKISHVLRGVEWQVSTPKHLLLYRAFGWAPPQYAHLPLLINPDGTKLSKRQNDLHVEWLRKQQFYPEAVLNFVSLVGGGFQDKEYSLDRLYSMEELVERFRLAKIHNHPAKLEMEGLRTLNQAALKTRFTSDPGSLVSQCRTLAEELQPHLDQRLISDSAIRGYLSWGLERLHTLRDLFSPELGFLWRRPSSAVSETLECDGENLLKVIQLFEHSTDMKTFQKDLKSLCKTKGLKFPEMMSNLRVLVTGAHQGPPLQELVSILGRDEVLARFKQTT